MSIKNKLVTAITTAGLLAGLFGSAFVPTATARSSQNAPRAALTKIVVQNLGQLDDQLIERNHKYNKANSFRIGSYANGDRRAASGPKPSGPEGYRPDAIELNDYSIGFILRDSDGDPIETADLTATVTGSSLQVAWAYAGDDADGVISCGSDDGPAVAANGSYNLQSVFGASDTVTGISGMDTYYQDSWTDQTPDLVQGTGNSNIDYETLDYSDGDFEGMYWLCIRAKGTSKGVNTVTVSANGVKVYTFTVQVVGDLATLNVSTSYPRIALNNDVIRNYVSVEAKDSAGQTLIAHFDGWYDDLDDIFGTVSEKGTDDSNVETHADGADMLWVRYGELMADGSRSDRITVAEDTCDDDALDSDEGQAFEIGIEVENWDGDIVQSNDLAITCTGPSDEGVISEILIEGKTSFDGEADYGKSAAGKADSDGVLQITGVVKDQDGRLMGRDSTTGYSVGAYSVDGDTAGLTTDLDIDDATPFVAWPYGPVVGAVSWYRQTVGVGGKVILATLRPDMDSEAIFRITVVVDDANLGNSALVDDELEKELFYNAKGGVTTLYTLTRTRNAAKTVATWKADFGVACSNQFVYFDWENADGTKGNAVSGGPSLRRRANAQGVATFALTKRNMVVYVTAYSCDNLDAEVGPVKARFR